MSLPGVDGLRLLGSPAGRPIATVPAVREADGAQLRVVLVMAELDAATMRRVRAECAELEAILTRVAPSVVLPLLDHGVDDLSRPYLLVARPGPDLGEVLAVEGPQPVAMVVAAAKAAADGLEALAANGIVGSPPPLFANGTRLITMGAPLPPVLAELEAARGDGTGHEPPEVLGGADWTPAGQVYACASLLWTLLSGREPYSTALARLVSRDPPVMSRADVPQEAVAVLQKALSAVPSSRHDSPAEFAMALRDAVARPLGSLYLLDHEIGSGACGQVWAGRRRSGGEPIAVKLLRADLVEDGTQLGRFVREYHVLHRLRHPHLVRVDEFFTEGGVYAIVMDLVRGGNLRQFAGQGRMSVAEAASLLAQTADGLAAVHEAGLVHRDVKPENVLVAQRGGRPVALLSDFGIARPVNGSEHTQVLGTPSYLAPELAASRAPSHASDVYALGVMAYELLAGHKPFYGNDTDALLLAHIDQLPARPGGLPDDVWHLIAACLDKEPLHRPAAAQVAARWASLAVFDGRVSSRLGPPLSAVPSGSAWPPLASRLAESDPLRYIASRVFTQPPAESTTPRLEGESVTILSARPAVPRPEPPVPPRRWRRLIVAAIAVVLAGTATGVYLALRARPPASVTVQHFQYPVASTVTVEGTVATVSWRDEAGKLPGFQGYLVYDIIGSGTRQLTMTMLGADVTSFQVDGLRAGRGACFYVIAVGVTVPPPEKAPPIPCVTPPTAKPTNT
ncbi:serine/threonine-protein kinase [Allorhizocola rhizosphaerae]|uniref:serine/threonine-protein kinase n=1 Tax=Allorhizocola rhizosphaerae TaxID=1872709 RepID=UPI0013C2AC42|nr:serine/threonine-protein kinase [Allorhizocola rhizosphaerae]